MTPQAAQAALQFLERVTLQPAEIQTYLQVCKELASVVNPEMRGPQPVQMKDGEDNAPEQQHQHQAGRT